jgi:hypothetical protein
MRTSSVGDARTSRLASSHSLRAGAFEQRDGNFKTASASRATRVSEMGPPGIGIRGLAMDRDSTTVHVATLENSVIASHDGGATWK